jgi:hypothetical protein
MPNRYLLGNHWLLAKDYVGDKTNWRTMLKASEDENLVAWRDKQNNISQESLALFL